jgi:hypothetical protein
LFVVAVGAGCGDDTAEPTATSATLAESKVVPATDSVVSSNASSPTTVDTDTSDSSDESEATVTEPSDTRPIDEIDRGVQPQIDLAVADLAARLSVDPSTITIVSAAFVVWPDKGLGCPQHGMEYLQVQVDGTLIELEVDGERYRYHSGETRPPFLCERTLSAIPLRPDDSTPDASG